jgi:hypothetical protein
VQQKMMVNGESKSAGDILTSPILAGLLSDEGVVANPRYPTNALADPVPTKASTVSSEIRQSSFAGFQGSPYFHERIASWTVEPGIKIHINSPPEESFNPKKKVLLIFYALPNGNTTAQTIGHTLKPGEDWHYDIQHIGAQTRFLRELMPDRAIVVAYLENDLKSWPAWRKQYGDKSIPDILNEARRLFKGHELEIVLSGHSGGGSLIFGYLNAVKAIPNEVVRIAFLDSNYAYDHALAHKEKLSAWLKAATNHFLCVLAYNDAIALLDGKPFVSAAGGTWGKSHEMQRDLGTEFKFTTRTNAEFQKFSALDGRVQFILKENPEKKIFHTVQVERNGFIHAMLSGTSRGSQGYEYFGPRAYSVWIE